MEEADESNPLEVAAAAAAAATDNSSCFLRAYKNKNVWLIIEYQRQAWNL